MSDQRACNCRFDPTAERHHRPWCAVVSTPAPHPTDPELHHLLNRAIDGVVLHGESDRLRELVRELEADRERVQQEACRTAERLRKAEARVTELEKVSRGYCPHCGRGDAAPGLDDWDRERKRAEQAEAAIERARKLATQWAVLRAYGSAATQLRAALDQQACVCGEPSTPATVHRTDGPCYLDQPQQPTTTEADHA